LKWNTLNPQIIGGSESIRVLRRCITGVAYTARFDKEDVALGLCTGTVFDTLRHDEKFAFPESDVVIAEFDDESPRDDQKEFVGVIMLVPNEFAFEFSQLDLIIVEFSDDPGRPSLSE
jgi:hypothetical protein